MYGLTPPSRGATPDRPQHPGRGFAAALGAAALISASVGTSAGEPGLSSALAGRATLSGDWGGKRSDWALRGIEVGIDHYGDLFAVVDGGTERST